MFSPVEVREVVQNQEQTRGGKRHALLDQMLVALEVSSRRNSWILLPAPSFKPQEFKKMAFADFLENGWTQENLPPFQRKDAAESMEYLENIKKQFTDFTFLLNCGRGGFGHVWLVRDMTGMILALKTISRKQHESFRKELAGLSLFRQKIRNFKNLVQIHHVGQTADFFFYTMDAAYSLVRDRYIPLTLKNLFHFCHFSPSDSGDIIKSLLEGVMELHRHSLSHRDIKPDNVIFIDGLPKLCDMGLVSPNDIKDSAGTDEFMPPDFAAIPDAEAGISCDLYALGKLLYGLLANDGFLSNYPLLSREVLADTLGKKLNLVFNIACGSSHAERFRTANDFTRTLDAARQLSEDSFLSFLHSSGIGYGTLPQKGTSMNQQQHDEELISWLCRLKKKIISGNLSGFRAVLSEKTPRIFELFSILRFRCFQKKFFPILLESGADLQGIDQSGCNALFPVAENNKPFLIRELLKIGVNPMQRDESGNIPLAAALGNGNSAAAKILLRVTENPAAVKDNRNRTLLHKAVEGNLIPLAKKLIETYRIDVESRDDTGQTALHHAAGQGATRMVRYLVEDAHADLNALDNNRRTPLFSAIQNNRITTIQLLRQYGADLFTKDEAGLTPMEYAIEEHQFESAEILCKLSGFPGWEQKKILSDIAKRKTLFCQTIIQEISKIKIQQQQSDDITDPVKQAEESGNTTAFKREI